jgi:hypothetical protein
MGHRHRKKVNKFHFLKLAGCSLLRAESFYCSLDVLYGGLRKSKLQFLIKKKYRKFSAVFFSSVFGHQHPHTYSLKVLDPDPYTDPDSMNLDPQVC